MIALIIFVFIAPLSALGTSNDGICVNETRELQYIPIAPNQIITRPRNIPKESCCDGYANISDNPLKCSPICDPECIFGTCIKPNQCECLSGYKGEYCEVFEMFCADEYWGSDCDRKCECNGSNCTASEGICTCQAGFTGEHCNIPCVKTHYGLNCSELCDCVNGICDGVTGSCSCYPGFTGKNCSMECPQDKYGSNCTETCKCENDAICNGINGSCECKPGFQGEFCEKPCSKGFWGPNCSEICLCSEMDICDTKSGNCFCENGFTGQQCTKPCEPGFCGFECSQICSCSNGICSPQNCTCDCPPMMYGTSCSESCNCNKDNTEKCNQISGKCECKPGWIGPTCNEPCPAGFYGYNCEKECTCNWNNTLQCINGLCRCKDGFSGEHCDSKCEPGYYGSNCTKICFYTGLDNYVCDPVQGDICSSLYNGTNCGTCKCINGSCLKDKCDCDVGYYGKWCQERCSITNYGKNCENICGCINCRATDGYCKCQDGFKGKTCSDYCPVSLYNNTTNQCINLYEEDSYHSIILYCAIGSTSILALIMIFTIIICLKYKNKDRSYGMVNLTAPKMSLPTLPSPDNYLSANSNTYEREEPDYETIPDTVPSNYQNLAREDEIPRHAREASYFLAYETPRHVPQHIEMYTSPTQEYVFLNRSSIGPHRKN